MRSILLGPVSEYSVNNIELPGFYLAWYAAAQTDADLTGEAYLARPVMTYARHTRPYRELKKALFPRAGPSVALFPSSSLSACFRLVEADLGFAVLPRALGDALDFMRYCHRNPKPCPLTGGSDTGNPMMHTMGGDIDIRTDVLA